MLKNKQKNMKMRSSSMREINFDGTAFFRIIQFASPYVGTAVASQFRRIISGPPKYLFFFPFFLPIDPTTFYQVTYLGVEYRPRIYDVRNGAGFKSMKAHIFEAYYTDGKVVKIEANLELGDENSIIWNYANLYAGCVGRLPKTFRHAIDRIWIHGGSERWCAIQDSDVNNMVIYVDYFQDDYLYSIYSVLLHEAGHLYLDSKYNSDERWIEAQKKDGRFISTYARDSTLNKNLALEDLAESIVPFFAIRHRADRISDIDRTTIINTIPNRIKFFDSLELDMSPYNIKF